MSRILIADHSERDAQRCRAVLQAQGFDTIVFERSADAEQFIAAGPSDIAVALILWELSGPPFGSDLLALCRRVLPGTPVVVFSGVLDATLAARAQALGASDFLEKPLDSTRLSSCVSGVTAPAMAPSPLVRELGKRVLGESSLLLDSIRQVARAIPAPDVRVLLVGESGTGKELIARAIHDLGERSAGPWTPVNISEIPPTLVESSLFGHEKGTFTGAVDRHVGYFETAGRGTLFLDEIGDLDVSLQGKLLRVLQEREFSRLGSTRMQRFEARLVSATNQDLPAAIALSRFRRDLFHRIAEVTVSMPPLRQRTGDVDLLLRHFLAVFAKGRSLRFARETLTILRSYPFLGNVRELANIVRSAVIECDGDAILPKHLPLQSMAALLGNTPVTDKVSPGGEPAAGAFRSIPPDLAEALQEVVGQGVLDQGYRAAVDAFTRAFRRYYLPLMLARSRYRVTSAAEAAGIDVKTFKKLWRECDLPPLTSKDT